MFPLDFLVPFPSLVQSSSLDPSALLVSLSSLALPPQLAPCSASGFPSTSPCGISGLETYVSTSARLCFPSSPPWPVCPGTPLGSFVPPDQPQSVVAQLLPLTSGSPAVPRPSTPSVLPGFPLPPASLSSSLAPSSPRSAEFPSLPRGPRPSVSLLRWILQAPWFCLRLSVPRFCPALQPKLQPGSSHHQHHHSVPLQRLLLVPAHHISI